MSAALLHDLDYTAEEVLGKIKFEDLLSTGSRIFFQTHFYPLIKMQKKANEIFLSFLSRQKITIPVLLNVSALEHPDGRLNVFCGGMRISQRDRYENELLQGKKNMEQSMNDNIELIDTRTLLNATQLELESKLRRLSIKSADQAELGKVLSHDLQEPLRKISMFSSKLRQNEDLGRSEEAAGILEKISASADKMRQLLDSLEKYNSLDKRKIVLCPVNLYAIIETAKRITGLQAAICFNDRAAIDPDKKEFISDPGLLTHLFEALFKNAVQFKKNETDKLDMQITTDIISDNIFTELEEKYQYHAHLRITFSHDGLTHYKVDKNAFELFKRSHASIEEMGIELAYCRRIVQLLNGRIEMTATNTHTSALSIHLPFKTD